jgi:hypothetical protein
MDSTNEGPETIPAIPAHPRAGTRTIVATTGEYGRWKLNRVGLDLDDAIEEELEDYRRGLGDETGAEAEAYAANEPDVALWEGERCLAVIRPRPGGDPEVTRFDGQDDERPLPIPSTEAERFVWGMVKEYGAETCRKAICKEVIPNSSHGATITLSSAESLAINLVRSLGEKQTIERISLAGPYGYIARVVARLGDDAVDELRRIIAAGKAPVEVQAATVVEAESIPESVQETTL